MTIKTSIIVVIIAFFNTLNVMAQKDHVLFTLGGDKVYISEFSNIYEKNLAIVNNPSQKDIDNYLNLYINYRLKVKEAYRLRMDTVPTYIAEYNKYKNQLITPYLKDDNTEKDLVKEAYQRMLQEVNANHILIKLKKNVSPVDTLRAYNKLKNLRKQVLEGASFDSIAKNFSEDPSAERNNGNLGYFTVFQMVYPFETTAYTTPVGEVSDVFKTKFGFHIIKVNDVRDARGEVEVAHIMLKGDTKENVSKINNIKQQLDDGGDFAALAKSYSTDLATSMKGGVLPKFTSNKMVKSFADISFALKNIGDISKPFTTRYGWHIVKLLNKIPIGSFEEMKPLIDKKVKQGQRSRIIGRSVINRLLKEYNIKTDEKLLSLFSDPIWSKSKKVTDYSKIILTIEDKEISAKSFLNILGDITDKGRVTEAFRQFKEQEILTYYKKQLPKKFPNLDQTLREYREGLLLFDLMQDNIWSQAEKDSLGLVSFFENNRNKYRWNERVEATIFTFDKKENARKAMKLLGKNKTVKEIQEQLSKDGIVDLKQGAYEKTNKVFPKGFKFNKGISEIIPDGKQFVLVQIKKTLAPQPKELKETRGRVISDFQDYTEQIWLKSLQKRYPVSIHKKALKKLKRKYN